MLVERSLAFGTRSKRDCVLGGSTGPAPIPPPGAIIRYILGKGFLHPPGSVVDGTSRPLVGLDARGALVASSCVGPCGPDPLGTSRLPSLAAAAVPGLVHRAARSYRRRPPRDATAVPSPPAGPTRLGAPHPGIPQRPPPDRM